MKHLLILLLLTPLALVAQTSVGNNVSKYSPPRYAGRYASAMDSVEIRNGRDYWFWLWDQGYADSALNVALEVVAQMRESISGGDHPDLAATINKLANFHLARDGYAEAASLYGEALQIRRRLFKGDHPDLATSINNMATLYNRIGHYADAEPLIVEAVQMRRRVFDGDHPDLALSLNNLAYTYDGMSRYAEAEPMFVEALQMRRRLFVGDHPDLAASIRSMAQFFSRRGRFTEAGPLFVEALEMCRRIFQGDHPELAYSINEMAAFFGNEGRYTEAEPLFVEALEMCRRGFRGDRPKLATSIYNMAAFFDNGGRYTEAEPLFIEALEMRRRLFDNDHPDLAESVNGLANFYNNRGRYREAEPLLIEALRMYSGMFDGDHPDLAKCILSVAYFYFGRGRYAEAEPLIVDALQMHRRLFGDDHPDLVESINTLATFYSELGRYADAEPLFVEALQISRRRFHDDHRALSRSINNLALFYSDRGRYAEAEPLMVEALRMDRRQFQGDHPDLAATINNMALFFSRGGHFTEAEPLFVEALEMNRRTFQGNHPQLAMSIRNIATFYLGIRRYAEAEPLLIDANEMLRRLYKYDNPKLAESAYGLAYFYDGRMGYAKAEPLYLELLGMLRQQCLSVAHFGSEQDQLQFAAKQFGYSDAIASFLVRRLEQRPQLSCSLAQIALESKSSVLEKVAAQRHLLAQIREGDPAAAGVWEGYLQTHRAIEQSTQSMPADTAKQQQWKANHLLLEQQQNDAERQIARLSSNLLANDSVSWQQVQRSLGPRDAAVEFLSFHFFNGTRWTDSLVYYAIVMRPGVEQPVVVYLCEQRQLDSILAYDPSTSDNSYPRDSYNNHRLYQLAFQPLESALAGAEAVYLAPTGSLSRVAFGTLRDTSNTLLADRISLQYVGSTRSLARRSLASVASTTVARAAVFGGAQFDLDSARNVLTVATQRNSGTITVRGVDIPDDSSRGTTWRYLPHTAEEASSTSAMLSNAGWVSTSFTGAEATEDALKSLQSPRVLHVATHGFFFPDPKRSPDDMKNIELGRSFRRAENPMLRSGIVLSGANRVWNGKPPIDGVEDGIVTAYEISSMDLSNTELVVLSSCESGLGDIKGSEGVFGLQRAFTIAGAKSVIMSLWKVGDRATMELMKEFYTRWLGGETKQVSFAQAQAKLRKSYGPKDWGAFVMVER